MALLRERESALNLPRRPLAHGRDDVPRAHRPPRDAHDERLGERRVVPREVRNAAGFREFDAPEAPRRAVALAHGNRDAGPVLDADGRGAARVARRELRDVHRERAAHGGRRRHRHAVELRRALTARSAAAARREKRARRTPDAARLGD